MSQRRQGYILMVKAIKEKTKLKLDGFKIFVDAEWTGSNTPVSVQVLVTHKDGFQGRYIVINSIYEQELKKSVIDKWARENEAQVLFWELGDKLNVVHTLLKEYYLIHPLGDDIDYFFSGEVFIFYSFQDLAFAFG